MIEILSPAEVEKGKATGALVASILRAMRSRSQIGTNLLDIDGWTAQLIEEAGAVSCYVDYAPSFGRGPFGHYICTSVNDAVLHGLPHDYVLSDGDLLTLDLAMIETTRRALAAGIEAARPDARVGDISAAVGGVLKGAGFRVNAEFGGHGVGTTMHQDPHIANDGRAGRGYRLRPGLLLAIEPWIMADTDALVTDDDGWTLRSATGARTAHSEHTIAITEGGAQILTLRP